MKTVNKKSPTQKGGSTVPPNVETRRTVSTEIGRSYLPNDDREKDYDKLAVAFAITIFTLSALGLWKAFEIIKALV